LGLFRIALGLLLVADLASRWAMAAVLYSNEGVLTNHFALYQPISAHQFSLFFALSSARDVEVAFCLTLFVYLAFLVGYRTRFFHLLSLVLLTSLHARNLLAELWSDVPLHLFMAFSLLLPLGSRFSIDSVRQSLARNEEHDPTELGFRPPDPPIVVSLAVFAILLQLAAIHLAPALGATGDPWHDGTALYYALHQRLWVTDLGAWVGDHVPARALTLGWRGLHVVVGGLVLVPFAWSRRLALVAIAVLHIGDGALFNLGLYDFVMLAPAALLVRSDDWDRLRAGYARRKQALIVYFDADCGLCFATARLLARLDGLSRLSFSASASDAAPPEVHALADQTVMVRAASVPPAEPHAAGGRPSNELFTKSRAVARICRSLPLLSPVGWLLSFPGVSWLADRAYEILAPRRAAVSAWLGLAACGLPRAPAARASSAPSPRRWTRVLRESSAALLLAVVVAAQVFRIDDHSEEAGSGGALVAAVGYPRLFQNWQPALPDPVPVEGMLVIDALTARGAHVDPLAHPDHPNPLWNAYITRISQPRFSAYLDGLREFMRRRTGGQRGADGVISFTISWEGTPIAPPGFEQSRTSGVATRRMLVAQP